ncbi:helix-turn-helix domain-containing protein [Microbulbifer celer]|uniref:Helix-turn-helix domain-containing protein n=1 Tax=Microbulbifer celer TaxID=435905 RepID=A0ABW3U8I4_9GAMM
MANADTPSIGAIFGDVIRRRRADIGISQEELAHRAGVDRTYVSRIERGVRQPTITTLIGLGLALEVSASELVAEVERIYLAAR